MSMAVKVERIEPGRYETADGWYRIERGTGPYEDHGQSAWVISINRPPRHLEQRAYGFMAPMAEAFPARQAEPGEDQGAVMAASVRSLKRAKELLAEVGYKTLPPWRCRSCGGVVVSWREGWKHAAGPGRGSGIKHAPAPVDSWELDDERRKASQN